MTKHRKTGEYLQNHAASFFNRMKSAARAFKHPPLEDRPENTTIVFAHDWGNDGAQANIEHQIKIIGRAYNANIEVTTIQGIPPLGSPLIAAIEFDRLIDTHRITLESCIRSFEEKGQGKAEIQKRLSNLILINVFDLTVGSERVAAIVNGTLKVHGKRDIYSVSVSLVGPLNNGVIRAIANKLEAVHSFHLSNQKYHVDNLGCATWDGRAIFGPVAAYNAAGISASEFGSALDINLFPKICFEPVRDHNTIMVPLLDIDPIGNLVVGLKNDASEQFFRDEYVHFQISRSSGYAKYGAKFSDVPSGDIIAYKGSNGFLELAINEGNLAQSLGLSKDGGHLNLVPDGLNLNPGTTLTLNPSNSRSERIMFLA